MKNQHILSQWPLNSVTPVSGKVCQFAFAQPLFKVNFWLRDNVHAYRRFAK